MLFTLQRYEFFSKSQQTALRKAIAHGCGLPYKGTNFAANHNMESTYIHPAPDVVYPTKVRIFQQITTKAHRLTAWQRCCLPYKGTNFSANHNQPSPHPLTASDVVYPTKVRIFQQITTQYVLPNTLLSMLFTLQRYEFFSKSQQPFFATSLGAGCCLPYKGTNFSANHNMKAKSVNIAKMLFTLQRYEFFSKSQRVVCCPSVPGRCCLPYKGTNFSANHNVLRSVHPVEMDVVYPTKVRIFQQITT